MKKVPIRKCIVTGEPLPKKELLRIVKTPEGQLEIDLSGKLNGRGAYLKKDASAILLAKKKKALDRAFNLTVEEQFYEKILKLVK